MGYRLQMVIHLVNPIPGSVGTDCPDDKLEGGSGAPSFLVIPPCLWRVRIAPRQLSLLPLRAFAYLTDSRKT